MKSKHFNNCLNWWYCIGGDGIVFNKTFTSG